MEIVSTMGSVSLAREMNLDVFVDALREVIKYHISTGYSDSRMITVRLELEGVTYLFYRSGSFQICGAENEAALDTHGHRYVKSFESSTPSSAERAASCDLSSVSNSRFPSA